MTCGGCDGRRTYPCRCDDPTDCPARRQDETGAWVHDCVDCEGSGIDPDVAEMLRPLGPQDWLLGQWLAFRKQEERR